MPEICPVKIDKYSFFEAQKGKTQALDAHFATFKFVLKAWMKRGNDIQVSDDITNGTKDSLERHRMFMKYKLIVLESHPVLKRGQE